MSTVDTRFTLVANNGDKLYPYKKSQLKTGRCGFALNKPGEQDRNGMGHYTDSIAEVIQRVVFDNWSVRVKTASQKSKQREGSLGLRKKAIIGYELAPELFHIVENANIKPMNLSNIETTGS